MDESPYPPEMIRASMRAIHEAYGVITTRCADVNRLLLEYPDGTDAGIRALLVCHDEGKCACGKGPPP